MAKKPKKPIWYESARRHTYQAWISENCNVAILPDRDHWRWRVGDGELTTASAQGVVAKEGHATSRVAAKNAALRAAKKVCPVQFRARRR